MRIESPFAFTKQRPQGSEVKCKRRFSYEKAFSITISSTYLSAYSKLACSL
nr:MAG TPA: hypothetical protein [Caudoviricetes sp.]